MNERRTLVVVAAAITKSPEETARLH